MPESQAFAVTKLRGMDERWGAAANTATRIRDMTWDDHDGWKDSGGFHVIATVTEGESETNPFLSAGTIESMHWFAQHNGARQWLIWETGGGNLRYFNGSRAPTLTPWSGLVDVDNAVVSNRTIIDTPWQRTQSQAWGGRLYMVNGYDLPIVFDGTKVEQAGFATPPGAPQPRALDDLGALGMHATILVHGGSSGGGIGVAMPYRPLEIVGLGAQNDGAVDDIDEEWYTDGQVRKCAYRYIVTFLNERGQESPPSAPSALCSFENGSRLYQGNTGTTAYYSTVNESGKTFINVQIQRGGPETVARRIYRTRNILNSNGDPVSLDYGEIYYFLEEIQDNVLTSFEDGIPDSFLGAALDVLQYGVWPPGVKHMAVFKNSMFVAGHTSNELAYSRPLFPEMYPPDNVLHVGDSDMGPITGMYPTKNALIVFKRGSIYLVKGDPRTGFSAQPLTRDYGCVAPNSIRELPGLGLVFLSQSGVALMKGALENAGTQTTVTEISMGIPDQIERINWSAAIQAMGEVYHHDREYWLAVPTIGSERNNHVLVFHYEVGAWSFRENFPIGCMRETRDHRGYLFFGSNDTSNSNEGIWHYSRASDDKNGVAIQPLYETASINFGSLYRNTMPLHIIAYAVMYGDNDIEVDFRLNRSVQQHRATVGEARQTADQQDPNNRMDVYNTGVWGPTTAGAARWGHHEPTRVRFDVSGARGGPVYEFQATFSATGRRLQLVGYDIEASIGEKRKIKPLNEALAPSTR